MSMDTKESTVIYVVVAEWLGNGLQTRLSEFDSHPPLKIIYKKCLTLSKFIGSFRCKKKEINNEFDSKGNKKGHGRVLR